MKKEEIKITLENCEGYSKLHEAHHFDENERNKIDSSGAKCMIVPFITLPASFALLITDVIGAFTAAPIIFGGFAVPAIAILVQTVAIRKKHKKEVALQYPDINTNVSHDKLEEALEKVGILKYERDKYDELHRIYDINGYKNCILVNHVRKEMVQKQSYKSLKSDFTVSNKEMDKVKVKVKTMVRK